MADGIDRRADGMKVPFPPPMGEKLLEVLVLMEVP